MLIADNYGSLLEMAAVINHGVENKILEKALREDGVAAHPQTTGPTSDAAELVFCGLRVVVVMMVVAVILYRPVSSSRRVEE